MKAGLLAVLALLAAPLPVQAAAAPDWPGFPVILWQTQAPSRLPGLRAVGVTALKRIPSEATPAPGAFAGMHIYIENIATDFYAAYHRWHPDRPVTALFDDTKARYRASPADPQAFMRTPSLSDPDALRAAAQLLADTLHDLGPGESSSGGSNPGGAIQPPLFYNLGDETGIADLAAAWDFDLSPVSLAAMRDWLRLRYGSIAALNRQWGTAFPDWPAVQPELTTAAMRRSDRNWSAWADFKDWMDEAFARALRVGTDAIHTADPAARSGIEGGQVPGWGGYDYGRLASAVDVMEIYDAAANIDIALSLNPKLIVLTTSGIDGPVEARRLWRDRMRGTRGLVVWDDNDDIVADDGSPGRRGRTDGPVWRALAGPAAMQFAAGEVRPDGVAVLYSQPSYRTRWMLDHAAQGEAWTTRDAERENEDDPWRASLRTVQSALAHLALTPTWLTPDRIEAGALRDPALHALLLPQVIALSDAGLAEIGAFRARGGTVLSDAPPGQYDEHSRPRANPPDVAEPIPAWPQDPAGLDALAARLPPAPITLRHGAVRAADTEAYVRWAGPVAMVGVIPDTGLDATATIVAAAPTHPMRTSPALLVLGDPAPVTIQAPTSLEPGASAKIVITAPPGTPHRVNIVPIDPRGQRGPAETVAVDGSTVWSWHPGSGTAGDWTLEVTDPLSAAVLQTVVRLGR